jgi:hypothetical protein
MKVSEDGYQSPGEWLSKSWKMVIKVSEND